MTVYQNNLSKNMLPKRSYIIKRICHSIHLSLLFMTVSSAALVSADAHMDALINQAI